MTNYLDGVLKSRRQFISTIFPACALSCLGIPWIKSVQASENGQQSLPFEDRIQTDYCKSYEKAWRFRYGHYIETMEFFSDELGRETVIQLLRKQFDDYLHESNVDNPNNTFPKFVEQELGKIQVNYRNMLDCEIIENSEKAFELRVNQCLWAKTFCERNAGDIGYASLCYGDFIQATVYNYHLKLRLTKTLMQGDECCNHRYTWEL